MANPGARSFDTHYVSAGALDAHGVAFRAATDYRPYNAAAFASYPNAWRPTNIVTASLYAHPGYGSLARGLGLAATPVPYDYGGNVVVQSGAAYVNGDAAGSSQEYSEQATQIAAAGATPPAGDSKWLPLGIFALVEGEATTSDDVFQLAVNPEGIIRGNYHNLKSDAMESLSGSVDKKTQRAAWTIGADQTPVYDAGIANLTQESTTLLVHLGDGKSHQVSLIRLQQAAASEGAAARN